MGTSRLEALGAAIDELLARRPDDLDDDELHDVVVGLLRQSHRLAAAAGPVDRGVGSSRPVGP